MANVIRVAVDNPDELLNPGAYGAGAVVRLQSAATSTGLFASVTTAPIVSGTTSYTLYDQAGATSTWYRTRYENAGGTVLSDFSALFQVGSGTYATLTPLKQRLGLSTTDTTDDALLQTICDQANGYIESMAHRVLAPLGVQTYTFDGFEYLENRRLLLVPHGILTVTAVQVAAYTGQAYITVPISDIFLRPPAHQREPGWPATEIWFTDIPSTANQYPYFPQGFNTVSVGRDVGLRRHPRRDHRPGVDHGRALMACPPDRPGGHRGQR